MLTVVIHDNPVPQGSHFAVVSKTTNKAFVKSANEKKLKTWRDSVRDAVVEARGEAPPLEGAVLLAVTFTMHKPVSRPKYKFTVPQTKPDLDKLLRSTMDGLTVGGAYRDDARVVEVVRLAKYYPMPGGKPVPLTSAQHMLALNGTNYDILDSPGAVVRVASIDEFPNIREGWPHGEAS